MMHPSEPATGTSRTPCPGPPVPSSTERHSSTGGSCRPRAFCVPFCLYPGLHPQAHTGRHAQRSLEILDAVGWSVAAGGEQTELSGQLSTTDAAVF